MESGVAYEVDKAEFDRHQRWKNLSWYVMTPPAFVWIASLTVVMVDALVESVDWVLPLSLHGAAASIELGIRLLPGADAWRNLI